MKKFTVVIQTENAAFEEPATELARILRELADRVEGGQLPPMTIHDSNGNRCGWVK
jgi:hypothetical protein